MTEKNILPDEDKISRIHQLLRESGSRITPQREYVLEIFLNNMDDHLSAEDVYFILQKQNNTSISLATVYRTLKVLHKLGVLREIDLGQDHKHYEIADQNSSHHHIICQDCDHHNAIEFQSDEINAIVSKIAQEYNFQIKDVDLRITGKCLGKTSNQSCPRYSG